MISAGNVNYCDAINRLNKSCTTYSHNKSSYIVFTTTRAPLFGTQERQRANDASNCATRKHVLKTDAKPKRFDKDSASKVLRRRIAVNMVSKKKKKNICVRWSCTAQVAIERSTTYPDCRVVD